MKWLFFLLVLINISAFGWYSFGADTFVAKDDPIYAPPVSQKILTLSEAPEPIATDEKVEDNSLVNELEAELQALASEPVVQKKPESLFCPIMLFEKDQEKSQVLARLKEQGWNAKEYRSNGERQKYWVYISAPDNRQNAIKVVDGLKRQGVDSFIINRGEMKGRISLGLYSTAVTANTEKVRITKLSKLDVKVFEHVRNVPLSVVEIAQGISGSDWQLFISSSGFSKMMIKLEKNPC